MTAVSQPTDVKTCCRCKAELPIAEFHRRAASWDGWQPACKSCKRAERLHAASMSKNERAAELAARDAAIRFSSHRTCTRCGITKPRDEYGKSAKNKDGMTAYCTPCMKAYAHEHYMRNREKRKRQVEEWREANAEKWRAWNAAYYQANRERMDEKFRRWKRENPARYHEWRVRNRALREGSTCGELDLDALWNGVCGICGDVLDDAVEYPDPMSKSMDHIIPVARGGTHSQENLQWAHLRCNIRKSDRVTT